MMNIKSKLLMAGSALLFSATMAFGAAITADQLAAQFTADGYSYITIKTGLTQIKVEAVKDGTLFEVVYDIETGATIDTSTHAIGPIDTPDPGVIVRTVSRDFEDDHGDDDSELGDDDGPGHDLFDDHGGDDDSSDDIDDDSSDDSDDDSDDSDDNSGSGSDDGDDD